MHKCLTIQEIVQLIIEFCVDGELKNDQHTLLAIASTCWTFEEPALNRLWYKLESLRPLFKCLPQDAWERKVLTADPEIGHWVGDTSMVSNSILFASALNIILTYIPMLSPNLLKMLSKCVLMSRSFSAFSTTIPIVIAVPSYYVVQDPSAGFVGRGTGQGCCHTAFSYLWSCWDLLRRSKTMPIGYCLEE